MAPQRSHRNVHVDCVQGCRLSLPQRERIRTSA